LIRAAAITVLLALAGPAPAGLDCGPCHKTIAESFAQTAHARASSLASADTIAGSFEPGRNELRTHVPGVYFQMERRKGRFYQTGIQPGGSETRPFDLVIGSGRRGQSYLYWRDGLLFQLPVSYHVKSESWINSPGYEDGTVNFGRGIPPRCLACHASGFRLEPSPGKAAPRYAPGFSPGLSCDTCHGEVSRHEDLKRPSNLELCARCHSGLAGETHGAPDVHGNQVGLLQSSRCFQKSGGAMTCGACHDVHRMERDTAALSGRCTMCHQPSRCPIAAGQGDRGRTGCVDCHMPLVPSKLIRIQSYRTHRIAIYRK
jgi:hypothetical protein